MREVFTDSCLKFCYRLGKGLDKKPRVSLQTKLSRANVTDISAGTFFALEIITPLISAALTFTLSLILLRNFILALFVSGVTAFAAFGSFPLLLHIKSYNRMVNINRELPYALSHMSIMAGTGATPLKTIEDIATSDYGDVSAEFRKMLYKTNIQGEDAVTALDHLAKVTPSPIFRELCLDFANIIHTGGGLQDYLANKSSHLLEERRRIEKQFTDSLSMYAESYVGGILMLVILGIVGVITAGTLGLTPFGLPIDTLFKIFIYAVVPAASGLFLLILELIYLD
jgi:flagellar protein FlaJ